VIEPLPLFVRWVVWHIAYADNPELAPQLGEVYLTRCYRWIDADEARNRGIQRGRPPTSDDMCRTCEDNISRPDPANEILGPSVM
jgi:hypothetical protein